MEKYFVIVDGQICTAHTNRDGRMVDIRPCTVSTFPGDYGRGVLIRIFPPRGVDIKVITVSATRYETEVRGDSVYAVVVTFVFQGQEFTVSDPRDSVYIGMTEEARASEEARRQAYQREQEAGRAAFAESVGERIGRMSFRERRIVRRAIRNNNWGAHAIYVFDDVPGRKFVTFNEVVEAVKECFATSRNVV